MSIRWEMASGPSALEEVYRFRYEQYFADKDGLPGTDHEARRVWLPHDDRSWHFVARSPEGDIVAAGSATPASESSLYEGWKEMFELSRLEAVLPQLVLISRVIVARDARHSALFGSLCLHLAQVFTSEGYHYAGHYCSPPMVPMYERLGYRLYGRGKALHSGAFRLPMLLLIDDVSYLNAVRSPFRTLGRDAESGAEWIRKIMELCPELAKLPLCAQRDAERVQSLVSLYPPLAEDAELLRVLRRGSVLSLRAGDMLAPRGVDEGAFFVLSGHLSCGADSFGPGDILYTGQDAVLASEDSRLVATVFGKE